MESVRDLLATGRSIEELRTGSVELDLTLRVSYSQNLLDATDRRVRALPHIAGLVSMMVPFGA
jgi:hypothetical protein